MKEKIGYSTLYNCDCMDLMAQYPDKHFDLAIVDPPYRDKNQPTQSMRSMGKMKHFGYKPEQNYFTELFRVSQNQIIWGANNFIQYLQNTNNMIFWYKYNFIPNYSDGEFAWTSFDTPSRCFMYTDRGFLNKEGVKIHPTQKPVALYKWLLSRYAKPGDKILDTHFGSGSIAIACNELGFNLTASEIDQDYFNAACLRVREANKQGDLFREAV